METRKSKRKQYDEDKPLYTEIKRISDISKQTNNWTKYDQSSLNIFINDADDESNIVNQIEELDDIYNKLVLKGWDRDKFLLFNPERLQNVNDRQIVTIIEKISYIVAAEKANSTVESVVDSFISSLLNFLRFDYYPLSIHPQYRYKVEFMKSHHVSSIVEFMVMRSHLNGRHTILFVEDKHNANVSAMRDWEEPQIAGEIFGSAHHNGTLYQGKTIKYPFDIFAVRVVGTRFTFYKSAVNEEYLKECHNEGLPTRNQMIIKRYPNNSNPYNAWDFCSENDRKKILKMLGSIEKKSLDMDV
jgi:hypothetical protein